METLFILTSPLRTTRAPHRHSWQDTWSCSVALRWAVERSWWLPHTLPPAWPAGSGSAALQGKQPPEFLPRDGPVLHMSLWASPFDGSSTLCSTAEKKGVKKYEDDRKSVIEHFINVCCTWADAGSSCSKWGSQPGWGEPAWVSLQRRAEWHAAGYGWCPGGSGWGI